MDAIKVLTRACGIVCHSFWSACSSWRRFCGAGWRWRTRRSSSSQRCSIGLRSGERAGQRITLTFCCSKKSVVMRAVCGRALSCWNTSLLMFIAGKKCGLRISSRYRRAFKLPGTVTSCVFRAYEIAAHIITLPPPKLSTSTTQFWAKRSLRRLYTLIRPSLFSNWKRDSSLNHTLLQFCRFQTRTVLHHRTLAWRSQSLKVAPRYGRLARNPCLRSRFRTVCPEILRSPGMRFGVTVAATVLFRRWSNRMYQSWAAVVTRGRPERGRSSVVPFCWYRCQRREIVLRWTL